LFIPTDVTNHLFLSEVLKAQLIDLDW